jgi:hypothetical protein
VMSDDDRKHAAAVLHKALEQLSAAGRPVTTIRSEEPIASAEDG